MKKYLVCGIGIASLIFGQGAKAAFIGPPAGYNPPNGGGLFLMDANRNIDFNSDISNSNPTPAGTMPDGTSFQRVFMTTAPNNPGLGLKNLSASGRTYVLTSRNNGSLTLWDGNAAAERMHVDSNGNIVIGSANAGLDKLQVYGNVRGTNFIGNMQAGYVTSDIFGSSGGGGNFAFPASLAIGESTLGGLPTEGLYVKGSVGIGTKTPASKLSIYGTTPNVRVEDSGSLGTTILSYNQVYSTAAPFYINANSVTNVVIATGGGKVGIGTASPSEKLSVQGKIITSGITGGTGADWLDLRSTATWSNLISYQRGIVGGWYRSKEATLRTNDENLELFLSEGGAASIGAGIKLHAEQLSNDSVSLWTAGANRLHIDQNGNIGLGTTNPSAKLHEATIAGSQTYLEFEATGLASSYSTAYADIDFTADRVGYGRAQFGRIRFQRANANSNDNTGSIQFLTGAIGGTLSERMRVNSDGNIGIGTTAPAYKLDVVGGARFTQPVQVGYPIVGTDAATKTYVDTTVGSGTSADATQCSSDGVCEVKALAIVAGGTGNISGVNKLDAQTIDPVYVINGQKYATYVSDTIGLKMEYYGKVLLKKEGVGLPDTWTVSLDFKKAEKSSDLWLFWQTIDEGENMEDVIVSLTPNFPGSVWYELKPKEKQIVFYGIPSEGYKLKAESYKLSYHLIAPRYDAKKWGTLLKHSDSKGSVIEERSF
ncbi:hypothetical protein A3A21_02320 [Candidatus Jorgensenbacteria bacterium RIFCSPLOWO2_01_FULL_45_25b]|uniref:Uncharacterized protein n=1 Tax=Candidatus Jorgensenbacteria bacterium RIFCSPLOWO2_01_FULL_45_25b TaxID=1798471 RepID=A0A1F6C0C8_9BACT|nr:MAG: hypothetical protein A3A21_02320 [Candidatus Jorgensenbacteria bacterium RIFCSPLOWO2_01_FULL_45_25b]